MSDYYGMFIFSYAINCAYLSEIETDDDDGNNRPWCEKRLKQNSQSDGSEWSLCHPTQPMAQ